MQNVAEELSKINVEDELTEFENSFDIFGSDAVLEVLEKAIGFGCHNLEADEALFILNSVQNFTHFDHSPRRKVKFLEYTGEFKCQFCNLTGGEKMFKKKSDLRQHYRDHLNVKFKCIHCDYMDRLRKPVVCHIWNDHPDEVLDVDSTDLNNLLREQLKIQPDMNLSESDEENVEEVEMEMTMGIFSPAMKAKKGLQLNFGNILNRSITEGLDITLNFPASPMASPKHSPMANCMTSPAQAKILPKPLMKKLYLNGGKVTRVSDQGLTPRRSPFVKQENRLLKRIHLNNGKVTRISDQGLSPLVKNSALSELVSCKNQTSSPLVKSENVLVTELFPENFSEQKRPQRTKLKTMRGWFDENGFDELDFE